MTTLTLSLPPRRSRTAFNLRRWEELLADAGLAKMEGRIETDRHGRTLMSPPPAPSHGSLQSEIAYLLRSLLPTGRVLTECPISTADGVKAADVAWASAGAMRNLGNRACFAEAPELCVEVLSPANSAAEMREKVALYFDAGAREVWLCDAAGRMKFLAAPAGLPLRKSGLCPVFPKRVELR
ncbi:MAG TPA: Uma2 family endonuclease [Verrucomicrobiota bacterium]|nr:Uma2 family endonuclease [Verrucomicrobiota bacterium]